MDGADLVFTSKTNSADYHDEMNNEHYMEWLDEQLLPRLEGPSVIILDNASYHNKQKDRPPTTKNRKDDIRKWLTEHDIQYSDTDIKKTLLQLVKRHRPEPIYYTDETIHEHGHLVLRLPVAHCELNPIELAWATVKGYVAKENKRYNLTEITRLTHEGFRQATPDTWRHYCRHVVDIENDYILKDGILEDAVEEMVIDIGEDSDDDSDYNSDDEQDFMHEDDTQLIDKTRGEVSATSAEQSSANSSPQFDEAGPSTSAAGARSLTDLMAGYDPDFLKAVLPL